jgi:hypothetical protein
MKKGLKLIAIFALVLATGSLAAQTKTTTKAPAKSPAKKTAVKKKPAAKAGKVFICDGTNGYTFHSRKTCADLAKCKGRVLDMTKQDAINNWGRKQCKNCY